MFLFVVFFFGLGFTNTCIYFRYDMLFGFGLGPGVNTATTCVFDSCLWGLDCGKQRCFKGVLFGVLKHKEHLKTNVFFVLFVLFCLGFWKRMFGEEEALFRQLGCEGLQEIIKKNKYKSCSESVRTSLKGLELSFLFLLVVLALGMSGQ